MFHEFVSQETTEGCHYYPTLQMKKLRSQMQKLIAGKAENWTGYIQATKLSSPKHVAFQPNI